jgi:hypothetical protein
LRRSLLDEEIVFIFDFLIELFKYAEINDEIAISLGTHLVNDFYQMSFNSFSISFYSSKISDTVLSISLPASKLFIYVLMFTNIFS